MARLTPIIHCQIDPEPTSFHASDGLGQTDTFGANLSFEIPAVQTETTEEKIKVEFAQDESDAEDLLGRMLAALNLMKFHIYELRVNKGAPNTLILAKDALVEQVSAPAIESPDQFVKDWLSKQKPAGHSRFWTSLERKFDPDLTEDAEKAGAAPRLRAAQAWNAPAGHRQGLTHLVRLAPISNDTIYVVLPYFDEPGETLPTTVNVIPEPNGVDPNWAVSVVECTYDVLGELGVWQCRTNAIGRSGQSVIAAPPPTPPVDSAVTPEGFLVQYRDAVNIHRFLKTFEERAASIMTAANAMQIDGKEDFEGKEEQERPEALFGFEVTGDPPPPGEPDSREYQWGHAVWYVVTRLVAALDNHVLALLKPVPGPGKDNWEPNPESEGDVLAPLVTAILQETSGLEIADNLNGKDVAKAIRAVLQEHCPLIAGGPQDLLVAALRSIYGIAEPKTDPKKNEIVFDSSDPTNLVAILLAQYLRKGFNAVQFDSEEETKNAKNLVLSLVGSSVNLLATTLIDIEQPLHDEAGAERALIRLFEIVELHLDDPKKKSATDALTYRIAFKIANGAPDNLLQTAVDSAWARYKALLDGPFNGAEAIRQAVSANFADALLKTAKLEYGAFSADDLRRLTESAHFYKCRLAGVSDRPNAFEAMAMPLVQPRMTAQVATDLVTRRLDESYFRAIRPLITRPDEIEHFTPDSFPLPLPIQIASGIDGSGIDDFSKEFNGICVAIRRCDDDKSRWAYANLADLRWGREVKNADNEMKKPKQASGVLHPNLPAVADGRGPMFINYEGFPLADTASAERFGDDVAPGAQTLFYQQEAHGDYDGGKFERLPRLAYGRMFQNFSFAVSNAGVLPLALQRDVTQPWSPYPEIERLFDGTWTEPVAFDSKCQRCTAVARMAVIEQPESGEARILGESITGVQPLCADYPRLGLVADTVFAGVIDLFRESDGAPRIHLPEKIGRPVEWRLDDLAWSGELLALDVGLYDSSPEHPDVPAIVSTTISAGLTTLRDLRLVAEDVGGDRWFSVLSGDTVYDRFRLAQAEAHYWLRLKLTTSAGGLGSLSFADPEGRRPAGDDAPLVLLRPTGSSAWRTNTRSQIKLKVATPRVSFADYRRWMANSTLRDEAYTDGADEFERILLLAYLMRHLDARLAQMIDNLPDPAIAGIRIELLSTDSLTGSSTDARAGRVDLTGRLASFAALIPRIIAELRADLAAHGLPPSPLWTPIRLRERIFEPLDRLFTFNITLAADAFGLQPDTTAPEKVFKAEIFKAEAFRDKVFDVDAFKAGMPSGSAGQVSLHSQIHDKHFKPRDSHPEVFHPGLKKYATRQASEMLCYPATSVRIETMYDGMGAFSKDTWINAANQMIAAEPISNIRRYDIVTQDIKLGGVQINLWRLLAEIAVTTQRWRTTGQPIYSFIDPRKHARDKTATKGPVLPIRSDQKDEEVQQFEAEAFFDRPDIDAQTVSKRLSPLGERTVLQDHSWDAPSATYFRHRFTLRSRYAGALASQFSRSVDAWHPQKQLRRKEDGWTMRVAILADAGRLILTRPQLRALIPLTTAPGGESTDFSAPPVAAILQEPPYSRGGLADRIVPEVKTGFGYGFEEPKKKEGETDVVVPPVEILDSRKEIGPNPQLDYKAFNKDKVLGLCLRGEGPLGLTFDSLDAPAPAFPNTMLLLRPLSLAGRDQTLEEALIGVAMRRYLDPDWLAGSNQSDPVLRADRTWWIDLNLTVKAAAKLAFAPPGGPQMDIAEIGTKTADKADYLTVSVWKETIDQVKGFNDQWVTISQVERQRVGAIAILNQLIAPGRYSTSILATLQSLRVEDGESGQPLMLASFEWSAPDAANDGAGDRNGDKASKPPADPGRLIVYGDISGVRETMASATTSLRWVQTGRDFDLVRTLAKDAEGDQPMGKPHPARDFVARVEADAISFDLIKGETHVVVSPSTWGNPYPVHVHRHIGFITTRYLAELGRPVEVFCRKALAAGPATVLSGEPGGVEQAVRVIEFETPASVVCDKNRRAVPRAYLSSYFDLVATGYRPNDGIALTIRFLGSAIHLKSFKNLKVLLSQPGKPKAVTIEIGLAMPDHHFATGTRLFLRPSDEGDAWVDVWTVRDDGSQSRVQDSNTGGNRLDLSGALPGFLIELAAEQYSGDNAEFWTDISLLHGRLNSILKDDPMGAPQEIKLDPNKPTPGRKVDLDFDWLFSASQDTEASALVSPAALGSMTEAQARIISVSPPIPIL